MSQTNGKKLLQATQTQAIYTSCEYIMRFITGFVAEDGCVIVDKNGTTLYTDKRYIEAAKNRFAGTDVEAVLYNQKQVLERLASYQNVGISYRETSHVEYLSLENAGVKTQDIDEKLSLVMANKNADELASIQKACEIAEDAFNELLGQIKEGMTETQVAAQLEYNMRKRGAESIAFETIVAFGAHASVPHHETGNTKLCFGDEILMDFGCKINGYCSDITRTILFGDDNKHEAFKKAYGCVLTAHNLVKENLKSGMTAGEADAIAREYLKANGYGELFTHSLGHGIGLNVHEFPYLRPKATDILTDGMVFSNEPGVYVEGEYGIRIEDTITLENGKVKSFMNKTSKELVIL